MSPDEAKEWADAGLGELYGQLLDWGGPVDRDAALSFIRAGYGRGYCQALGDPAPLTTRQVLERQVILEVLVPVP